MCENEQASNAGLPFSCPFLSERQSLLRCVSCGAEPQFLLFCAHDFTYVPVFGEARGFLRMTECVSEDRIRWEPATQPPLQSRRPSERESPGCDSDSEPAAHRGSAFCTHDCSSNLFFLLPPPSPAPRPFFLHFLFLGFLLETLFKFAGWKALAKPPAGPPGAQRGSSCGHLKQGCWGRIGQPGLRSVADRRRLRPADLSHRASWPHANGEAPAVP